MFRYAQHDILIFIDDASKLTLGITPEVFQQSWIPFEASNHFSHQHADTLISLIKVHHLSTERAFDEIKKLTAGQAYVLRQLYSKGISGQILRDSCDNYYRSFSMDHAKTLVYLMEDATPQLSLNEAILELDQLTNDEASMLKSLYQNGLRGKHFGFRDKPKVYLSDVHEYLLRTLIQVHHLSPEEAMKELNGLSKAQAEALIHLFPQDGRGLHFRRFISDWSDQGYGQLLNILMHEEQLSIDAAMTQLTSLTTQQAMTVNSLYSKGLRSFHFHAWKGVWTDESHGELIRTLIQQESLSIEEAIIESKNLSSIEALSLSKLYAYGIRAHDFSTHRAVIIADSRIEGIGTYLDAFISKNHCTALTVLSEIYGLHEHERTALSDLYDKGLRKGHLLSLRSHEFKDKAFYELQIEALNYLIYTKNNSPEEACQALKGKSREQILQLVSYELWFKYSKSKLFTMTATALMLWSLPQPILGAIGLFTALTMETTNPPTPAHSNAKESDEKPTHAQLGQP